MNTNTYRKEKEIKHIPSLIRLGIAMDYQVKWGVHRIIRDFVQNFYDSIGAERFGDEFEYNWEITEEEKLSGWRRQKERMLHIRMRTSGHSFSYEWLTCIGGSTKTGERGYAGEYGEGFKIALLSLMKLGGDAVMASGGWELHPCGYTEKIERRKIQMFGYRMEEREDDGFTTLDLYGIPASYDNIRYTEEALLEFFYPGNPLLGDRIEETDDYALYARSAARIPCAETGEIPGVLYYKYIARGRLPFPAVIHLTELKRDFDYDRSREILSEATVVSAVYKVTESLSPGASYWLLTQMKGKWKDFPVFKKELPADLNTWYYVICQLVRNISTSSEWISKFSQEYPVENYAYLERMGSDSGKNQLLREAKRWFEQENRGGDSHRRRLVNPIFRLLGVSSILQEYTGKKETLYRHLEDKERERSELLKACAKEIFPGLDQAGHFPEVLIRVDRKGRKSQACEQYGILPYAETRIMNFYHRENRERHIKYQVQEVIMEEKDLSEDAEFQMVLLKYLGACVSMYGKERSERSNGVLTYIGAMLYRSRDKVEEYEGRWKKT